MPLSHNLPEVCKRLPGHWAREALPSPETILELENKSLSVQRFGELEWGIVQQLSCPWGGHWSGVSSRESVASLLGNLVLRDSWKGLQQAF